MIKFKYYSYFLIIVLFVSLSACQARPANTTLSSTSSRAGYYSNTLLWNSDMASNVGYPLNRQLLCDIEAVGGEVYQSGSFVTIIIPSDALFEPATAKTLPQADQIIINVAKIIARFPGQNVIITAHADNIGSYLSLAKLTHQQSQLFAIQLWQQDDIDLKTFQHFQYAGMGSTQAITDDSSEYGQSLNRRIQITIYPSTSTIET